MGLQLITPPAAKPVTLAIAKAHLRIDGTDDDAAIERLISAATAQVQHLTQRALVTQTWRLTMDAFPCGVIKVPLPPLQAVTAFAYTDTAGVEQPLTGYQADNTCLLGRILPAYGTSWPAARCQPQAVKIDFTAGYDVVPDDIVAALLLIIGHLDQNREAVTVGQAIELPLGVDALLAPYCIPSLP